MANWWRDFLAILNFKSKIKIAWEENHRCRGKAVGTGQNRALGTKCTGDSPHPFRCEALSGALSNCKRESCQAFLRILFGVQNSGPQRLRRLSKTPDQRAKT